MFDLFISSSLSSNLRPTKRSAAPPSTHEALWLAAQLATTTSDDLLGGVMVRCGDGAPGPRDSTITDSPNRVASSRRDRVDGGVVHCLPASRRSASLPTALLVGRTRLTPWRRLVGVGGGCRHRDGTVVGRAQGQARAAWLEGPTGGRARGAARTSTYGYLGGWLRGRGRGLRSFFDRVSGGVTQARQRLCYFEIFWVVVVCSLTYD